MRYGLAALCGSVMMISQMAQAGVVVGATRLVYEGDKKESSLSVNNPDALPYLIQSWVEPQEGSNEKAPFILTPPLFRLDGGRQNVLRVVRVGGSLPEDRESLYWLNVKSIPSAERRDNTLQIAIKTRIKLIYRPASLKGLPETVTGQLTWHRKGTQLEVSNPTPFYMNFQNVTVNGHEVKDATYVAPHGSASFSLPAGAGNAVTWRLINDFGGPGALQRGALQG
ncbi:Chaperone protein fimC precursor [Serratia quinivorans]|uniref:fimbrial biogenesis chaperone n=1 Tax=Serratia quinivorans TaxID=137545 RepID=UPI00217AA86E|nr:Chaperone protein fimC precursor [Serratia quinivorans]CAI1533641.1 Chaperone protein fimC precursor [Serratia quinivorans]CAI1633702.1 Chaperone protein fimC precursor [Serratia quinivorans]CAI2026955.1 Chaperone protein fimC precursor [Serratia quinivorans]CAI2074460.1 Chaperone protein fimC precursor [Serratia quinivorans]